MLLYGRPGSYKTSFAAQFPGVVFAVGPQERGIEDLKSNGLVDPSIPVGCFDNWTSLMSLFDELITAEHSYQFLAGDSLTEYQRLLFDFVTQTHFDGKRSKFAAYGAGFDASVPYWDLMLQKFERMRVERNIGIILIAHSKVKTFQDPLREAYDQYMPDLHDGKNSSIVSSTYRYCSDIGYISPIIYTHKDDGERTKGKGGEQYEMHFNPCAAFEAKNRRNLKSVIPMGSSPQEAYSNFCAAIAACRGENGNG